MASHVRDTRAVAPTESGDLLCHPSCPCSRVVRPPDTRRVTHFVPRGSAGRKRTQQIGSPGAAINARTGPRAIGGKSENHGHLLRSRLSAPAKIDLVSTGASLPSTPAPPTSVRAAQSAAQPSLPAGAYVAGAPVFNASGMPIGVIGPSGAYQPFPAGFTNVAGSAAIASWLIVGLSAPGSLMPKTNHSRVSRG